MRNRWPVLIMGVITFAAAAVAVTAITFARDMYVRTLIQQHPVVPVIAGAEGARVVFMGDSRVAQWARHDRVSGRYVGFPGASSHQIASVFTPALLGTQRPAVVIIQLGINDLRLLGVAPERVDTLVNGTLTSLRVLADTLANHAEQVVVLTVFPTADPDLARTLVWSDAVQAGVDSLNGALLAGHWPDNVRVMDCTPALADLGNAAFVDTLHLSAAGYDALNRALEPELQGILPAAQGA